MKKWLSQSYEWGKNDYLKLWIGKRPFRLGLLVWAKSTYSETGSYLRCDIRLVTVKSTFSEIVSYFQFHEKIQAQKGTVKLLEIQKKNLKAREEKKWLSQGIDH